MALKNNTKSKILPNRMKTLSYIAGTQENSLRNHNLNRDENKLSPNDHQMKAVFENYDLLSCFY